MQSDLSISLNSIFSEREEGFLHSLQQALSAATTDKYIRQMFDDKLSANYVPDRICELIKFFLNDERELFVEELLRRLKALEACLGSERIKQLEEIGQRLMEVSQTQAQKEAEYRKCVQILNDQIGNFQENIGDELKIMKTNVSSLSNSTKSIFNTLQKFKLSLSSDFQDFKKQSRKLVKNLSNTNEKVNDQMKKIKSDNSNLMRQVNQLKEALDELRISKDNALRAQAEQFYSDISKLKEDFNNQRMEDLELNKQTENQMNQMRETLRNKFADKIQKIQQEAENAIKEMNVAHDNDVTALQKKVNRLNAKNNMLKDELSQSLNSINSLKNGQDVQIRKLQNKILKLSEQNEKNEADLSRKQEKIKKTQQENDKLNNEIQIINQKLLENDRMLQDAAKNLMQKQNEVDHNVFEKSKLIASKNEISQSLSNMNDELRNKDKELSQIQDKLDEVNKEKQSVIKEKEDIQSELNNLIKKAKKKDETIDQLSEKVKEIPKLQDEIDDLKGKNGKLEETKNENSENRQTIEKLQNQNKKLQASVNKLQNQIKDKDFELESKQNAIDSFEKENNEQTDLNTKLQTSLMQTKDQIRQKDKELNMLKQAIEEQQSMTQRQLFDLESMQAQVSQIPTLQNEKQDAIMKANLLERQNHELKSKINELQITIQQVRQQLHQIKAIAQAGPSKEELSRQIQSLLKENSTLKVKNKNLLGQLQSCQDELSSTKHHFDTTTSQFREKTRKLNELQNKLNSSQEIVNDSKLKIEDLTEKCSEYESSLKILAKKYQQKDKLIGSQKKSQNELRRKLQASEENNQKLSSSLSNVNNELLSLREELRNKNNENVQLKESLENNSMTARELTSTQRSLNDKISLLNNCEERNAALLRDIEKKEAKIGQLSDTLMEKDKEIQNLKQAQYTQKKQNETLTALTQDQQRQLDEGHRNLMKMQEEILRVQNEALSKGDSIKAIEVDHNREAEGRKQIQALINEDREKYRERITKLQDDNSSLLVEKAELEHKINQIKFENQTLSQLLESKESELSFEKERGNQDLLSTREMTSKIMVENKQLRQKLNDKEQYDKQLLAQIQEYIKSLINLDDIPELSRKMMETQEELQEICDTLNVKDPSEIPGEIDRIRDLNKALKANENKLHSLFPDNNADDIFNLISNLKKENSELQEMKSQLQQLTKSSNIIKSVQSLLLTIKAFDKRETELIRMIPNYEFENLTKDIAKLLKDNQKQNNLLEEIKIESGSSSIDSIPSIISEAINKLNFYTNIEKNLKQLIPISSMSEASDYIEKILKSDDELGLELSKANACIPSEYEGDLSSKISNLAKDNLENKSTIKSIIKGLPEHLQMTNDLSGTVSKIAHENEELKRQHKDILNTHLNNALQNNRELLKERNQIALNLNCTESDDLPEKTLEVIEEKNRFLQMVEEIEGILPKSSKGTDIFSRLKFLLKELENSQKVLKAIRHSIDSDDDHLINNVNNLVKKFADSENLLNEIESYFPPSHEILSDRVKYLIDNSNEMNEQLQALKNLFPKSNKDLQNDVANLLKEHNHVNQTIKQLNEIINGENNHDNIIEKAKEMKEKIEKGDQLLTKVKDILNDPTLENDNVPPSLQALVKHIQKLENKMKEIDGLLPKSKGQEDVVTKLKREKKRKEDLKKLLDNIINLLPHCSTEQEIERSLSEILEFLKSLYHLIYIQNIDKMKRVIKTDIKTQEADLLSIQCIEYEQIIDDLQHIFEEFQHNIVILSDFDQILPRNKDTNIINRLNKELQKKKQQEDLLNEIQKALSQRNHHTTDILSCLQEELALSNDLQDIVETLHSILPQNHDDRNRFEDDFDAEKREFNRSIIPKVQQEIDMKNSFQKKILEIENLLPKSKDDNLSNRLKKELDKKEQLQKQLDDLSSRFDHCKTFDDLSSHISELLRNNSNLKNILYQIDGLFSEVQNKVINDYDEEDEKEKDDFSYLIQIIGQYIDNTNSLKRKLEEIESLLPKYKNQGDLVSRLKDEFNKKEKVQQLAGKLQNIIPGVKTPEELAKKVQKILQEKEIQKTIIEQLNDILPELSENRTSNYDEEEDDNQMIEIGHNLPKRSQDIMNKYNQMKTLLDAINNLLPQNNKNDLITKLKKELKNKDRVQQQMEKLNNLLDSTSGNGADLSSKLKDLIQENEEMKQQLDELDSTLPQTNEDDDLLTRIKKLIKSKENQDSLVTEIESTLPLD
ncbi:hypothetical protein TRFO_05683 [Tritrichomonas foetus]|uniref:Uncharacterized protein n=1 Tax=Tritrichomonas foetus TaxID=1144522 RepID=A0A1J4K4Y8_9EUKA|nr:hypothetical protein TRFO_05683 [Tritrichomonas foetus]|eukprot:OHT06042.1 hypothetical protein TRFO_05683 [Tritrichomonas foetus]